MLEFILECEKYQVKDAPLGELLLFDDTRIIKTESGKIFNAESGAEMADLDDRHLCRPITLKLSWGVDDNG